LCKLKSCDVNLPNGLATGAFANAIKSRRVKETRDTTHSRAENKWVFRACPNDLYSSKVIADFGVNTLKLKKWAIVHATDAFGQGGAMALTEALQALGVTPVLDQLHQ
jgi:ABC-type branched-subunit amino acid transport system substrate-binding protein